MKWLKPHHACLIFCITLVLEVGLVIIPTSLGRSSSVYTATYYITTAPTHSPDWAFLLAIPIVVGIVLAMITFLGGLQVFGQSGAIAANTFIFDLNNIITRWGAELEDVLYLRGSETLGRDWIKEFVAPEDQLAVQSAVNAAKAAAAAAHDDKKKKASPLGGLCGGRPKVIYVNFNWLLNKRPVQVKMKLWAAKDTTGAIVGLEGSVEPVVPSGAGRLSKPTLWSQLCHCCDCCWVICCSRRKRKVYASVNIPIYIKHDDLRVTTLVVRPDDPVETIKHLILQKEGYPIEQQQLVFEDKVLRDEEGLDACGVKAESTVLLHLTRHGLDASHNL